MRSARLRTALVENIGVFLRCEPRDEFEYLADLLMRQGFVVDSRRHLPEEVFRGFDKYVWMASDRYVAPLSKRKFKVFWVDLMHALMHRMVGKRYGFALHGKRQICQLSEALACCLDIYFALKVAASQGFEPTNSSTLFHVYVKTSDRFKKPFLRTFNGLLDDPFGAYRDLVKFFLKVLRGIQRIKQAGFTDKYPAIATSFSKTIEASPWFVFAQRYDFMNHLLYVDANCGPYSSRLDRLQFQECMFFLNSSRSLSDFLQRLEASTKTGQGISQRIASTDRIANRRRQAAEPCSRTRTICLPVKSFECPAFPRTRVAHDGRSNPSTARRREMARHRTRESHTARP